MAQKIKKQFFRILPLSVAGLMVLSLIVGVWQMTSTEKASAAQPLLDSASITDTNGDGTDDQITINFSEPVTIVDGNAGDGLTSLGLTNGLGCALANADYASAGTPTLVATLTGCPALTTDLTPTITYTSVASCATAGAICDVATATQMANGANVIAADAAAPVINTTNPADIAYWWSAEAPVRADDLDLLFSEPVVTTYVPSEWTFTANGLTGASLAGCITMAGGYTWDGCELTNGGYLDLIIAGTIYTGVSSTTNVEPTISWSGTGIKDASNNIAVPFGPITLNDLTEPYAMSGLYIDADYNGTVDSLSLQFSENIGTNDAPLTDFTYVANDITNSVLAGGTYNAEIGTDIVTFTLLTPGDANITSHSTAPTLAYTDSGATGIYDSSANSNEVNSFAAMNLGDGAAPTLSNIHIQSNNALDVTLAKTGDTVFLTFVQSEPLSVAPPPTVVFYAGGNVVYNSVAIGNGDGTCGDITADNTWTACYVVDLDINDYPGAVTFSIDSSDIAGNPSLTYDDTDIIDGSAVTVDLTVPTIQRSTFKTQTGAFPNSDSVLWYNHPDVDGAGPDVADTFEAYVEGTEALSVVKVCIKSLRVGPSTAVCSPADFANLVPPLDYVSSPLISSALYTFTGGSDLETIAGHALTANTGYAMNIMIADEAGNVYIPDNTDLLGAFVMVWNIEPKVLDLSGYLNNAGTTDWATIDDFTDATVSQALTFRAEDGGTLLGQLSFPIRLPLETPINLADMETVTALQSFASNVVVRGGDAADGGVDISVDSGAIAALDMPADLTIALPSGTTVQPGMVVYNNDGSYCDAILPGAGSDPDACGNNITDIIFNSLATPPTITFTTDGFSGFGADAAVPTVSTYSPADGSTGMAVSANLALTFTENVQAGAGDIVIKKTTDDSVVETITVPDPRVTYSGMTATIDPTATLANSTGYYVQIASGAITDMVGNAYAGIIDTTTWNFTTAAQPLGGGGGYGETPADTTPPTNTSIIINSGATDTSSQSVTLTLGATDAVQMMISNSADFSGASWETYAATKSWIITGGTGTKTVYAKFKDAAGNISTFVSDTINSTATTEIPADNAPGLILTDPAPAQALPVGVNIGSLVKRADMTSVYFIDQDNRRHAFPNEAVYFSYYPDFSGIQTISSTVMAAIPLGNNVTMRPGTYLVKIQTDPKVYAVEPYGVLKGIGSEAIAISLYGTGWGTRLVDVEPTFFGNYQIGSAITTATLPTGSAFSYLGDSKVYYIDQGNKRYISTEVYLNNKFQNKFIIRNLATSNTYPDGANWPSLGMEEIMTLR